MRRLVQDVESDTLELRADLETGQRIVLQAGRESWLTLYDADDGRVLLEQDLSSWHWDTYEPIRYEGVRSRVRQNHRGTSKQRVRVRMKGLDLPELPDRVRVRIRTGTAIASQSVPLVDGRYDARSARPLGDFTWIDSAICHKLGKQCSTVLRGRLSGDALPREVLL